MNIAITFRHMEPTEAVKAYATEKVAKVQKFLKHPLQGHVVLSCQSRTHIAEVDVHAGHDHFHAHESSEDMYASIDRVIDKIEQQIRSAKRAAIKKGGERASAHLLPDVGED